MATPSLSALRCSDVSVRTTPLICGCQASVTMRTRIRPPTPRSREGGTEPDPNPRPPVAFNRFVRSHAHDNCDFVSQLYDNSNANVTNLSCD